MRGRVTMGLFVALLAMQPVETQAQPAEASAPPCTTAAHGERANPVRGAAPTLPETLAKARPDGGAVGRASPVPSRGGVAVPHSVEVRLAPGQALPLASGALLAVEPATADRIVLVGSDGVLVRAFPAGARLVKDRYGVMSVQVAERREAIGRLTSNPSR